MSALPILDAHMHLDPHGLSREAVRAFKRMGGTHLVIVNKPYDDIPLFSPEDYRRTYETTLRMTRIANDEGVRAWCVLGPYPGELPYLAQRLGLETAKDLQIKAVDIAAALVGQGDVIGLGEIGRVHFETSQEVQDGCDEVLEHAFSLCAEAGCPAILHTESPSDNPNLISHLASMADRQGLGRARVVKHYSHGGMADPDVNLGITPSILATRSDLILALEHGPSFLMETDYIDSRERPNVVLPPDMVPKKVAWLKRTGAMDDEMHSRMMVDLPAKSLGIDTEGRPPSP